MLSFNNYVVISLTCNNTISLLWMSMLCLYYTVMCCDTCMTSPNPQTFPPKSWFGGVTHPQTSMAETFEGGTSCQYHNHNNQANIANISNSLIKSSLQKFIMYEFKRLLKYVHKSVKNKSSAWRFRHSPADLILTDFLRLHVFWKRQQ